MKRVISMSKELAAMLVGALFGGGILIFIGSCIKFHRASYIINYFDENKYDKERTCDLFGGNFLTIGIIIILLGVISIFIDKKYYEYVSIIQTIIAILGVIYTLIKFRMCCKKS